MSGAARPTDDLTRPLDAKLRELAETRGIDINAEDWRRSCGPYHERACYLADI